MASSLIAKRYAKALFGLALEMNLVEEARADMDVIISVCHSNKDFVQMLRSPVIRTEKKQKVLKSVFGEHLSELSLRYLDILARKRRESFIQHISEEFISIYKEFKNIFTVHFRSAQAISDDIRKKVIALLEEQTGANIDLQEEVKKELIGGFVMNYNDYKYDASIAYQLKKMRKSSAEINLYIRGI